MRLPRDDFAGAVVPVIGQLYAWVLAVLRQERAREDGRQGDGGGRDTEVPAYGGHGVETPADEQQGFEGSAGVWARSCMEWLARRWYEILRGYAARDAERAHAIWHRLALDPERRRHDAVRAAQLAWPLLDLQARMEWLVACESVFAQSAEQAALASDHATGLAARR